MKSLIGLLGVLVVSFVVVWPAYAASEGMTTDLPPSVKTLGDFQKEYSGTKPVVAYLKYYDYLKNAPKPTLGLERMRTGPSILGVGTADQDTGTKPVVKYLKGAGGFDSIKREPPARSTSSTSTDPSAGSKPVLRFLKR